MIDIGAEGSHNTPNDARKELTVVYVPGSWLFIISAVVMLAMIILNLDKWRFSVGRAFIYLMVAALVWNVMFIFELASPTLTQKLFFARLQFIAIALLPVAWLNVAIIYTVKHVNWMHWSLILLIPVVSNLILWLAPLPNIFWGSPRLVSQGQVFSAVDYDYGFWFTYILMPYTYAVLLVALTIMAKALGGAHRVYRNQILMLILGTLLPAVVNIFYILGISPIPYVNMSTAVLSITGVLVGWALFRYKFLDLTPIARDMVIENMSDGLLVLDTYARIVDFNTAAMRMLGSTGNLMGKPVVELLHEEIGAKITSLLSSDESRSQVELARKNNRAFDIKVQKLYGIPGYENGSIVTFHDVTEREDLYHQVKELATRDSLTGVYNRGAFLELGTNLYASSSMENRIPLSAIMFDIDHFKIINDTYGHNAGDTTLTLVSKTCIRLVRDHDIVGRLGGDEFALLLPQTNLESALAVAHTIHTTIHDQVVLAAGHTFQINISVGVATTMMDGVNDAAHNLAKLLSHADTALYQAKNQGRGRVVAFNDRSNALQ